MIVQTIGYVALLMNLLSMSMKDIRKLRICALLANLIYVFYGWMIDAAPIYIGCTIAVMLHGYRIFFGKNNRMEL